MGSPLTRTGRPKRQFPVPIRGFIMMIWLRCRKTRGLGTGYSIFAMWMSDVHSVGGYTFAASLFLLGLFPVHVVLPTVDFPARHGNEPQVHRLLRPSRLRGDVHPHGLDPFPGRLCRPRPHARRQGSLRQRSVRAMGNATLLVVSYFAALLLNFGD